MASKRSPFLRDARIFCLAALLAHLGLALIGWNRPLLDHYAWRQTQTAITAAYLPIDGYRPAYSTPIFGAPAAAPLEFPLYAALASSISRLGGWPLDAAGRGLSLFGFLAAAAAAAVLMRRFVPVLGPEAPWIALGLLFLSPLYIFYSRAFLIETTALALSLFFLEALLRSAESHPSVPGRRLLWAGAAFLLGTLAGLTKVTVLLIACAPAAALLVETAFRRGSLTPVAHPFLALAGAVAASYAWVHYTDVVKAANPLASAILSSKSLVSWNFGTSAQYLSPATYRHSFDRALPAIFGMKYTLVLFVPLFVALPRMPLRLGLLGLGFLAGPLVFLNLFFVHEYYWTENALYLFLPLGALLAFVLRRLSSPWLMRAVLLAVALLMLNGYRTQFLPLQNRTDTDALALAAAIEEHVPAENFVLYLGYDYDPSLPYYSHRRALMDGGMAGSRAFEATYQATGPERIAAAVVTAEEGKREETVARLAALGFAPEPAYSSASGALFIKVPTATPAQVPTTPAVPTPPPASAP
ncbi:hypothetical protein SAMN05444156_0139 [Verrucomicrobium sp. GAS474]|uniref:hypothetical protein n=1 Tax=Verrucomicrobium sp. GAS474 TaxID=1882831 RepID=UPI000879529A|nr:hypothetical protein [Verrucomicrobium sp. GAS474]SDT86152.1 hypothetical protein SAMN05444156_0139 [Verrucomicrobium sp. GAS474]